MSVHKTFAELPMCALYSSQNRHTKTWPTQTDLETFFYSHVLVFKLQSLAKVPTNVVKAIKAFKSQSDQLNDVDGDDS